MTLKCIIDDDEEGKYWLLYGVRHECEISEHCFKLVIRVSIQSYIIAMLLLLTSSTFRQNKEKKEQKKHIGRFEHLCIVI